MPFDGDHATIGGSGGSFCSRFVRSIAFQRNFVSNLSPAGQQLVQVLAQRHAVSPDAVTHMLIAVQNGNGTMAQFNHQEFGGGGQWMRGGMTMVSDLFNYQLKSRVDNLCSDISNELARHQTSPLFGSFQSQSQSGSSHQAQAAGNLGGSNSLFLSDPERNWWPRELEAPNAVGSQNNVRYAYFANARRLAVSTGGDVWIYDTGEHHIGGFSQQQGVGGSITFSSQFGTVNLSSLPVIMQNGTAVNPARQPNSTPPFPHPETQSQLAPHVGAPDANQQCNATSAPVTQGEVTQHEVTQGEHAILAMLEKLGELRDRGFLSDEEFHAKKTELLSRL